MFTSTMEENFFLSRLSLEHNVLEYGSGESTIQISKLVKKITSIEHQPEWFNSLQSKIPDNVELFLAPPNLPYVEGGHDGEFLEFENYINAGIINAPYDVVLIDGRARVECAKLCQHICNPESMIFIHDFHRPEYLDVYKWLEYVDNCESMFLFKLKGLDN